MNLTDAGCALIEEFEGFRSQPYQDAVKVWTIGYGSTKGVGPNTPAISRADARARMRREVDSEYGAAVNALGVPLNQHQFDALVSFVYNTGPGAIASSTTIGTHLRARRWDAAADALLEWNKGGKPPRVIDGLTRRRQAERELFLTPCDPWKGLTKPERKMVNRRFYHARKRAKAPRGSPEWVKQLGWSRFWRACIRTQMARLKRDARAPENGGWERNGRGHRYQLLGDAYQGKEP